VAACRRAWRLPPALYIAGRDLNPNPTANTAELGGAPLYTTGRLMHCS